MDGDDRVFEFTLEGEFVANVMPNDVIQGTGLGMDYNPWTRTLYTTGQEGMVQIWEDNFSLLPEPEAPLPVEFGLYAIYPSPFNSKTTISFGVEKSTHTSLSIYDLSGREVRVLFDGTPGVGHHRVVWDASGLPSGIYIVKLEMAGRTGSAKVALVR